MTLQDFLNSIDKTSEVIVFADGACSGNPGPGGWGIVVKQNGFVFEESGGEKYTTNNRMELMAAIQALNILEGCKKISITTDSQYLKNGVETWIHSWKKNGWKTADKKLVKNQDLWIRLDELCSDKDVKWYWVKGHSGVAENEKADTLARQGIIKMMVNIS